MFRASIAALAVFGFAASASAQPRAGGHMTGGHGGHAPSVHVQPSLPLSPGVMPGSPFGPGTQFIPFNGTNHGIGGGVITRGNGSFSSLNSGLRFGYGYGGYGYGYGGYGYGYGGYGYDYGSGASPIVIQFVSPLAYSPAPRVMLANEFPATLVLQFPGAADIWLNGKAVEGDASEQRTLTSPVLKQSEKFTFDVKARWTSLGKTYESTETVTLGSGDRSRLLIVSGTEVK